MQMEIAQQLRYLQEKVVFSIEKTNKQSLMAFLPGV
jgi:hypothetical protein